MRKRLISAFAVAAAAGFVLAAPARLGAELPPIIPRDALFGNPERSQPRLSPDGQRLAWIAPDKKNVLQVWVKTVGKDDDKMVTADKKRGIRRYFWAEDNKTLALPAGQRRRRELPRLRRGPRDAATSATTRRFRACARTSSTSTRTSPAKSWSR